MKRSTCSRIHEKGPWKIWKEIQYLVAICRLQSANWGLVGGDEKSSWLSFRERHLETIICRYVLCYIFTILHKVWCRLDFIALAHDTVAMTPFFHPDADLWIYIPELSLSPNNSYRSHSLNLGLPLKTLTNRKHQQEILPGGQLQLSSKRR